MNERMKEHIWILQQFFGESRKMLKNFQFAFMIRILRPMNNEAYDKNFEAYEIIYAKLEKWTSD